MAVFLTFPGTGVFFLRVYCHEMPYCTYTFVCGVVRETRLRHNLGVRYDSRSGVYDWDYHMKLQEMVSVFHSWGY